MARMTKSDLEYFEAVAKREAARKTTENAYHVSRGLTGEPSEKNRVYKASDDCWKRGLKRDRTVGSVDGQSMSVKVTRRGKSEIVSARGFGRSSIAAKSTKYRETRIASDRALMQNMGSNHEGDV